MYSAADRCIGLRDKKLEGRCLLRARIGQASPALQYDSNNDIAE